MPNHKHFREDLSSSLKLEWELQFPQIKDHQIASIYFGGGTPALLTPPLFAPIFERFNTLHISSDCEITIEANPESIDFQTLVAFRTLGINRISFGVQSLDDRSLQILERQHSSQKAKEALFFAKKAGFDNISIDLMYDLPSQTLSSFQYTLDQIKDLPITHLSLYNLTIEPHTAFHRRQKSMTFPSSELSFRLLDSAIESIEKAGLERYEISAFAKPGFESRHNIGYWTRRPFLGFGPSAFSYWNQERFQNIAHLQKYKTALENHQSPVHFRERLPFPSDIQEAFAIELRLLKQGVNLDDFKDLPEVLFKRLENWERSGWIQRSNQIVKLTPKGALIYDTLAIDII